MKNKLYLILYYLIIAINILLLIFNSQLAIDSYLSYFSWFLVLINIIAFILFNIFIIKQRKINVSKKDNILLISYLIFMIIISICCIVMDKYVIVSGIHYLYYYEITIIPLTLLNFYSLLCIFSN